ncbi:TonB-dependent Receptor Plug Domain [Sphingomonas palmae]|uniref:TonB-dependent Receptor Plug Domain n=1 Tax=Sphingomonas palmae TaxID=1855283 RepID=A0A1H7UV87_9SPHN|nr:TonB-dependent receptor [Sphingomonas palmae]SEM00595.1 TonB-dependent Receptor Plug Domain [Sphingomonas palmae]
MISRYLAATALASATLLSVPAFAQGGTQGAAQTPTDQSSTVPGLSNEAPAGQSIAAPSDQAAPTNADGSSAASSGDILVTGTRLRNPNAVSAVPITTVSAAQLTLTARTSIGDVLNDLPQLVSTFSQSNSTRFLGTSGLNLLDLRGLGTQRTLVLVNGRRHVGSDILSNGVSVDTNTIPTDLIESVDIVTGANSAVYGSDALAGVVNFRLKSSFDGLLIRGQGGISDEGDAGTYFVSATAGKNFADGRGNIAINVEYARTEDLFGFDRKAYRQNDTFLTTNIDASGVGSGGNLNFDGIPDSTFFRDVRVGTFSDGGLVAFAGAPLGANSAARCGRDYLGRAFTCNYLFQPGGSIAQQTGSRVGIANGSAAAPSAAPAGSFIGGNGNTRREGTLLQLLPQLDRYAANLIGHFDVSDAFKPFIEAKYVRVDSVGLGGSGPAFFTGSTIDALYERPRLDNPFLSADARTFLTQQALQAVANGQNPNSGAAITAAQAATLTQQINSGAYRFILRKNLTDLGSRREDARRETYRFVGGFRGDLSDHFNYEVSGNYGEFKERTKVLGNVDVQRLSLALDAVRNPANGQIVCGSQLDASRFAFGTDIGGNAANLANDIANCQPLNPFGTGSISQAAKNYVLRNTTSTGKITQLDFQGNVAGDTGGFFNLPGGAIAFSLGAEYRRETNYFAADPFVEAGYTFYNALARFDPPSFEVKEAFGEINVPLLKDLSFAKSLSIGAAGRVSDYKGSAGTVYTYNLNAEYAPTEDIRFRANYGRGVRAPNLNELYSPTGQNFAPGFADPCSADNLGRGTQFRAANCAAAGIPTTYNYQYVQSLEIQSGGNDALNVEKSDSYTYGAVFTPRWVPGLTLTVDYYNIKVKDVITAVSAQGIANNCYDSPSIQNNPFCAQFQRVAAGATGPNGEQAYRIIEGSLLTQSFNFASLRRRGIDTDLSYTRNLGSTRVTGRVIYTHTLEAANFTNPLQPAFGDTFNGELGYPKDQVQVNLGADFGAITLDTQFRYLSKQSVGAIENLISYQGRAPQNLDAFEPAYYPDVLYIGGKIGFDVDDKGTNFYIGVDNLTDRLPPLGATGTGFGSGIFDNIGRRFYAGFTGRF